MIENNTEQLSGQFELEDFLGEDKGTQTGEVQDGYDAEGHLLNEDYAPEVPQTPAPDRLTVIAGEIATITQHARVVLASAAIDIGKRLIEAQGLVEFSGFYIVGFYLSDIWNLGADNREEVKSRMYIREFKEV